MKPYIKRRRFCPPSLGRSKSVHSSAEAVLALGHLDRLSVFETLRSYHGRIFRCEQHLRRLSESCMALDRCLPLGEKELKVWLHKAVKESGYADSTLRLSIHWLDENEGEWLLFIRPFLSHPKLWYEKGVEVRSTVYRRSSLKAQNAQIKASQYVGGVLATLDTMGLEVSPAKTPVDGSLRDPHELVFFAPDGSIAEGSVSNIFIVNPIPAWQRGKAGRGGGVKQKCLLTPSTASGILRGVTRAFVIELAQKRGVRVVETTLTRHDLFTADECFLTNTSSEVLPVVAMDGRRIGTGLPGRLTRLLGEDFRKNR